jgi:putative DNA primase/helicase
MSADVVEFAPVPKPGGKAPKRHRDGAPPEELIRRAGLPLNDLGGARRLAAFAPGRLIYAPERGWHAWDGQRYRLADGEAAAWRLCAQLHDHVATAELDALIYSLQTARAPLEPGDQAKVANTFRAWAKSLGNAPKVKAILETHATAEGVYTPLAALDAGDAFAVANGTVRLCRSAGVQFEPGWRMEDRITLATRAAFRPEAQAPGFESFLKRVQPDPAMRDYLQRVIGYSLFLGNSEQKFFIFQGKGGDGKSTFLNAIAYALGDLVGDAQVHSFLASDQRKGSEASPDIAALAGGVRLVKVSEPPKGSQLDEGAIKQYTGGEPITARGLFKELFSFAFQACLILSCNPLPHVRGDDKGIHRRLQIIQWPVSLKEAEQDRSLGERLKGEADGILAWALEGVRRYLQDGLDAPNKVREAGEGYRATNNPWTIWWETCVERVDRAQSVPTRELRQHLVEYLSAGASDEEREALRKSVGERGFARFLDDLQVENDRDGRRGMIRRGVRLLTTAEQAEREASRAWEKNRAAAEAEAAASGLAREEPGVDG